MRAQIAQIGLIAATLSNISASVLHAVVEGARPPWPAPTGAQRGHATVRIGARTARGPSRSHLGTCSSISDDDDDGSAVRISSTWRVCSSPQEEEEDDDDEWREEDDESNVWSDFRSEAEPPLF